MKTITINVTCTYDVEITKEVSDEVYDQLCDILDDSRYINDSGTTNDEAWEFLSNNVNESDAQNIEYRIDALL